MDETNTTTITEENKDKVACYELIIASIKQTYPNRFRRFNQLAKFMLRKLGEETFIFYLMEFIRDNR